MKILITGTSVAASVRAVVHRLAVRIAALPYAPYQGGVTSQGARPAGNTAIESEAMYRKVLSVGRGCVMIVLGRSKGMIDPAHALSFGLSRRNLLKRFLLLAPDPVSTGLDAASANVGVYGAPAPSQLPRWVVRRAGLPGPGDRDSWRARAASRRHPGKPLLSRSDDEIILGMVGTGKTARFLGSTGAFHRDLTCRYQDLELAPWLQLWHVIDDGDDRPVSVVSSVSPPDDLWEAVLFSPPASIDGLSLDRLSPDLIVFYGHRVAEAPPGSVRVGHDLSGFGTYRFEEDNLLAAPGLFHDPDQHTALAMRFFALQIAGPCRFAREDVDFVLVQRTWGFSSVSPAWAAEVTYYAGVNESYPTWWIPPEGSAPRSLYVPCRFEQVPERHDQPSALPDDGPALLAKLDDVEMDTVFDTAALLEAIQQRRRQRIERLIRKVCETPDLSTSSLLGILSEFVSQEYAPAAMKRRACIAELAALAQKPDVLWQEYHESEQEDLHRFLAGVSDQLAHFLRHAEAISRLFPTEESPAIWPSSRQIRRRLEEAVRMLCQLFDVVRPPSSASEPIPWGADHAQVASEV